MGKKKNSAVSGEVVGKDTVVGASVSYDTPKGGIEASIVKDLKSPGARATLKGDIRHELDSKDTEVFVAGSVSRNFGPVPANPSYEVRAGITHRF